MTSTRSVLLADKTPCWTWSTLLADRTRHWKYWINAHPGSWLRKMWVPGRRVCVFWKNSNIEKMLKIWEKWYHPHFWCRAKPLHQKLGGTNTTSHLSSWENVPSDCLKLFWNFNFPASLVAAYSSKLLQIILDFMEDEAVWHVTKWKC